ncbi:MAG TPA: DPP IV N-terminal domain-containing protein, partial [Pyrinomonadaceae bacterium]|nr:DPP IV N-terminal domain-containing protein [Pyrinomonadaceae bacterium]
MSSIKLISLVVLLLAATILSPAQSTWSPEVQVKTRIVGNPRISPDGKRIVYTVNDAVMTADKSEFVTQIWLASSDGKENNQITFNEKSSSNPKWSPDGNRIAFTSNRKDNKNNLYVLRVAGGEAEQITDLKSSISDFEWSPDGGWIAYSMSDAKTDDEEKNDKGKNDYRWVDENQKLGRLYVIPIAKDANGKREAKKLTSDNRHVTGFDWSPDGARIVFNHVSGPGANEWPSSDISIVEVASGKTSSFAATAAAESAVQYSPDGKWIAGTASDLPVRWAQSYTLRAYPVGGGEPKVMALSHDAQPNIVGWTPDGRKIVFYESKGTGTSVYEADVAAGTIKEIKYSNAVITAVSMAKDGSAYAFVIQSCEKPPEVAIIRSGAETLTQISRVNSELTKMPFGKTEVIKWKSTDGREIEGLLTYPVGYVAGTKVPFILNIHGGPAGVFQQN